MECNKDEAIRAADIAEKKYNNQDLAGCKKFALKAMQLFPGLDRARQMLSVVEVQMAAVKHQDDWYGILQVDPVAEEATIKKQYRKLALMLHPDKNNIAGAEQAFKLINEAWGVLSDRSQRIAYDQKRGCDGNGNGKHKKAAAGAAASASASPPAAAPASTSTANGHHGDVDGDGKGGDGTTEDTFWTQCPSCRIQYQYYRKFENYQLLCHRCQTGFLAKDIGAPPLESQTWAKAPDSAKGPPTHVEQGGRKSSGGKRKNGMKDEASAATAFQQMQQRAREREEKRREDERRKMEREREREEKRRLKEAMRKAKEEERRREAMEKQQAKQREREEREARKKSMENLKKKLKRSRMLEDDDDDEEDEDEDEENNEEQQQAVFSMGLRRSHRPRRNVVYRDFDEEDGGGEGPSSKRLKSEELSEDEMRLRNDLIALGRQHVLTALRVMGKVVVLEKPAQPEMKDEVKPEKSESEVETKPEVNNTSSSDESEEPSQFYVPDSDFHDFDMERKEEDVQEGQVWALYDDSDGMPRYYCEIKQVRSRDPFEVQIRWLEMLKDRASEMEEKWKKAGFALTSGLFKLARRAKVEKEINMFSHQVQIDKVASNVLGVYPRKGEVWALYRDWSLRWLNDDFNLTMDGENCTRKFKYEMVEVVGDLGEDEGRGVTITVMVLVKVTGFKSIFARGETPEVRKYTTDDLLRFSHRVCAHWMTGNEKANAPKDCWQLDTAATPVHLISDEEGS